MGREDAALGCTQPSPVQRGCFVLDMVVDLKVLDSILYDDDPEHIKISFGESFFSSWRKYFFWAKDLAKDEIYTFV